MGYGFGFDTDRENRDALFEAYIKVVPHDRVLTQFKIFLEQDERENGIRFSAGDAVKFLSNNPENNSVVLEQLRIMLFDLEEDITESIPDL